jgi:phage-related protein
MAQTFTFNGTASTSYDIIVKKLPLVVTPERNIDSIKIDGRNGNLHIDYETYNSYNTTMEIIINDLTELDAIKAWLTGTGTIIFSDRPTIQYSCVIKNQLPFDMYAYNSKVVPIQMELSPLGLSTTQTTVTKTTSPATFTVGGTYEAKPSLEIKGTGEATITLNGTEFTLTNCTSTAYIVDCDLQNVTKSSANVNDEFSGDFPSLIVGTNNLSWTGTISEIKVIYRATYL